MPIKTDECFWQWIEIDRRALASNVRHFRALVGRRRLLAVVKANAYGHGIVEIARLALAEGVDWLGVHSLEEGAALRQSGIAAPILVLGPVAPGRCEEALRYDLRLTVYDRETGEGLSAAAPSASGRRPGSISRSKPERTVRVSGRPN